jgi:plastocyanin
MKKSITAFVAFIVIGLLVTVLAACGGSSNASGGSSNASGGSNVHMSATNFMQSSITISKGSSVSLVNDTDSVHIIQNGMWNNGSPQPMSEMGAPMMNNMQVNSANQTVTVGPFNTTGTYHLYCTIHPGMTLTVIVQ